MVNLDLVNLKIGVVTQGVMQWDNTSPIWQNTNNWNGAHTGPATCDMTQGSALLSSDSQKIYSWNSQNQ